MDELTLGQKLKFFRQRARVSQLELELEIKAASGSVSRIETDKVNPTKETLQAIVHALKLNDREAADLFSIRTLFPTGQEILAAIKECDSYLSDSNRFAYLLDEWANFFGVSIGFINAFNFSEEQLLSFMGKHIFELFFDHKYGIRQAIDPEKFDEIMVLEIARLEGEMAISGLPQFKDIFVLPGFDKLYAKSKGVDPNDILSPAHKKAYLLINGQKLEFTFSREHLKENFRFELVEFFNPQPYE